MRPQEAAQSAFNIAKRERLPLARIAEMESGSAGAAEWFGRNILNFFSWNEPAPVNSISGPQLRRYIAWMRSTR